VLEQLSHATIRHDVAAFPFVHFLNGAMGVAWSTESRSLFSIQVQAGGFRQVACNYVLRALPFSFILFPFFLSFHSDHSFLSSLLYLFHIFCCYL
jgi:hypothetical protein